MKQTQEGPSSKMQCSVHDEQHIVPQIVKQDVKFNSRFLSRESSRVNSSSRVFYYGGAKGAVPFLWESQPGTPKHTLVDKYNAPPLTPPPSFYGSSKSKSKHKNTNKPRVLRSIFSKLAPTTKLSVLDISPSSSSSSCTSSSSSTWSATSYPSPSGNSSVSSRFRHENHASCSRSDPFISEGNGDDDGIDGDNGNLSPPTSILRFGGRSKNFLGCCPMKNMTDALFSIAVRHGSNKPSV